MTFADVVQNVHAYEASSTDSVWLQGMGLQNLPGLVALEEHLGTGVQVQNLLASWTGEAQYEELRNRLDMSRQRMADYAVTFIAACSEEFKTHVDGGIRQHVLGVDEVGNIPVMQDHVRLLTEQRAQGDLLAQHLQMLEGFDLLGHASRLAQVREQFAYTQSMLDEYDRATREELTRLGHPF